MPSGWRCHAKTPTSFGVVRPGHTVQAVWTVTAPRRPEPATVALAATARYRAAGQRDAERTPIDLVVTSTLDAARANAGISDDSDVTVADFDGAANSYSRQALADAGLSPGGHVDHDGVRFVWPGTRAGEPDNVLCDGQTLALSGRGSKLGFLGASSGGTLGGLVTIHYDDGTTSQADLRFDDWFFEPGPDNDVVARTTYLNADNSKADNGESGRRTHPTFVFYTSVPVRPGMQVLGVTLPRIGPSVTGHVPGMHVFALGLGG